MANVLYAYDKKDVEKMIDLIVDRIRKIEGFEATSIPESDKLTQKQAAHFLGISETSIISWKKKKRIPFYQIGRAIFYSKKELLAVARSERVSNEKDK